MKLRIIYLLPLLLLHACISEEDLSSEQSTDKPLVKTSQVTSITSSSAVCGGIVDSAGSSEVSARGVCWSTSQSPDITSDKTIDGKGIGTFSSTISGLEPGTSYFVRAYATNTYGTSYGNSVSFTTTEENAGSTVTDVDGNEYKTVKIGNQEWFAENLKTASFANGDEIPTTSAIDENIQSESSPSYQWIYNGKEEYIDTYGRLYTWHAATDNRNICPYGWHLPTDAEWTELEEYLTENDYIIVQALASKTDWSSYTEEGTLGNNPTNASGFNAKPGGLRYSNGDFYTKGHNGFWWTSGSYGSLDGYYRKLSYDMSTLERSVVEKSQGHSVRCVKD